MSFPDGDVIIGSQMQVDNFCRQFTEEWDDGTYIKPGDHIPACTNQLTRKIWLVNSCAGVEAYFHEKCHLMNLGRASPNGRMDDCSRYNFP